MVAVLGWTVGDFASRSYWTENVQKVSPVVICIGISHIIRDSPCLLYSLGSGGHPIAGITAQLADSLYLFRCPPHPTRSIGPGLPHRTLKLDAGARKGRVRFCLGADGVKGRRLGAAGKMG